LMGHVKNAEGAGTTIEKKKKKMTTRVWNKDNLVARASGKSCNRKKGEKWHLEH